jgi:hypothetical protein
MKSPFSVVDMAGGKCRRMHDGEVGMLPLSLAWSDRDQGDIALAVGGRVDLAALESSGVRLVVLDDPWKTTLDELDRLSALELPVCPVFSFLPKLWNADQPAVETPVFCESYACIEGGEIGEVLLEQVAVLRAMGAEFHGPSSLARTPSGYTMQNGGNILSAELGRGPARLDARAVSSTMRLEAVIPGGASARPARIRVATQGAIEECPPRFERSARLMWRLVLRQLEHAAPLPYGLNQLRDDIECCHGFLD